MRHPTAIRFILLLTAIAAGTVHAQSGAPSPLTFNFDRFATQFRQEQPGWQAGAVRLLPSAALSLAYDSNVLATPAPRETAALLVSEAELVVENEPGVLALQGHGFVRDRRYADIRDQDATEYGAAGGMRIQLGAQDELTLRLLGQRRFESRTDIETPNIRELSFFNEWRGVVSYAHTFNRLTMSGTASVRRLDYDEPSQQYRDRALYRGDLRAAYRVGASTSLILTGFYGEEDYRRESLGIASAQTTGALLGLRWDLNDLLEAEFSAGHLQRDYANGGRSTLTVRSLLNYRPTRLTTLSAELIREDASTTVAGALAKIRTEASIGVLHEFRRNMQLYVNGTAVVDEFDGTDRTDAAYFATVGFAFLIGTRFVVGTEYDYATRDSDAIGERFVRHVVSLSLQGHF